MRVRGTAQPSGGNAEEIDGYRDFVQIGQGGFSVVYRARQEHLDREVAVKVLAVPAVDEKALSNFLRECQLASRLTGHPNVVTVLDTGTTRSGRPYVTMEYFEPGSLKQRLTRDGPLPLNDALRFGVKIAGALAAAHNAGILHRDIKPDNILVSGYGELALADFGIARLLDAGDSSTRTNALTLHHTAPELLMGTAPSQASDVYALGSTLYQLLSGQPAHRNDTDESIASVMQRILNDRPPDIPRPEISNQVMDVVRKAMAKQQRDRFTNALDFAAALQHLQAFLGFTVTELPSSVSGAQTWQPPQREPAAAYPSLSGQSHSDNTKIRAGRLGTGSRTTLSDPGTSAKILSAGRPQNDDKVPSKYRRWGLVLISLIAAIAVTYGGVIAWGMVAESTPTTPAQAAAPSTAASPSSTSAPALPSSISATPVLPPPPEQAAPAPKQPAPSVLPPPPAAGPTPERPTAPQPPPARPAPEEPKLEEPGPPPATRPEPPPPDPPSASTYNAQQIRFIDETPNGVYSVQIIGHNQYDLNQIESCFETPDVTTDINDMWWAGEVQVYTYSGPNCTNETEGGYMLINVPATFDGYYWICLTDYGSTFNHQSC
ncbi:MAG: serine/threonine protein kinase [Pseudonocardiaceae bacterium]